LIRELYGGFGDRLFAPPVSATAFIQSFAAVTQALFLITRGQQRKVQRQTTVAVAPVDGEHPKAFQITLSAVVPYPGEQFHHFGS